MKLFLVAALILQHGCVTTTLLRPIGYKPVEHAKEVQKCVRGVRNATSISKNYAWLTCDEFEKDKKVFKYQVYAILFFGAMAILNSLSEGRGDK